MHSILELKVLVVWKLPSTKTAWKVSVFRVFWFECGEMWTRKTSNTNTFHAVIEEVYDLCKKACLLNEKLCAESSYFRFVLNTCFRLFSQFADNIVLKSYCSAMTWSHNMRNVSEWIAYMWSKEEELFVHLSGSEPDKYYVDWSENKIILSKMCAYVFILRTVLFPYKGVRVRT